MKNKLIENLYKESKVNENNLSILKAFSASSREFYLYKNYNDFSDRYYIGDLKILDTLTNTENNLVEFKILGRFLLQDKIIKNVEFQIDINTKDRSGKQVYPNTLPLDHNYTEQTIKDVYKNISEFISKLDIIEFPIKVQSRDKKETINLYKIGYTSSSGWYFSYLPLNLKISKANISKHSRIIEVDDLKRRFHFNYTI